MTNKKEERSQKTILLVDELEMFNRYGQQLESCGYKVAFTQRGDFALEMMGGKQYDAIVIGTQIGGPQVAPTNVRAQATAGVTSGDLAAEIIRRHPVVPVIIVADEETVDSDNTFRRHVEGALPPYPRYVVGRFSALQRAVDKATDILSH